jgi:hypothetical protein
VIYTELFAWLQGYTSLTEKVATRIFPYGRLPQSQEGKITGELPAITTLWIGGDSHHTNEGVECYTPGRFQFTVWSRDAKEAQEVDNSLRRVLDGAKTVGMGGYTVSAFRKASPPIQYVPTAEIWQLVTDYEFHIFGNI